MNQMEHCIYFQVLTLAIENDDLESAYLLSVSTLCRDICEEEMISRSKEQKEFFFIPRINREKWIKSYIVACQSWYQHDILHYVILTRNYQFLFRYHLDERLSRFSIDLIRQKTRSIFPEDQEFCWELFRRSASIKERVRCSQMAQNGSLSIPNFNTQIEQKQQPPLTWLERRDVEQAIQTGSTKKLLEIFRHRDIQVHCLWISSLLDFFPSLYVPYLDVVDVILSLLESVEKDLEEWERKIINEDKENYKKRFKLAEVVHQQYIEYNGKKSDPIV
jgi:hypothetical protein